MFLFPPFLACRGRTCSSVSLQRPLALGVYFWALSMVAASFSAPHQEATAGPSDWPRNPSPPPLAAPRQGPQERASRRVSVSGLPGGTPTFLIRTESELELPRGVGWASSPEEARRSQSLLARLGSVWSLCRATTFWRFRSVLEALLSWRSHPDPWSESLAETWKNFCNAPNLNW